ncbi:MAG: hypothetical protein AB1480_05940 [Nitrospirota bacterium]
MKANKIPERHIPNATPVKAWYGVYIKNIHKGHSGNKYFNKAAWKNF